MNAIGSTRRSALWGVQGWLGLLLVAVCWPLNWTLPGNRTAYLFFPLWLGYILVVDALVLRRTGTSRWKRSRFEFFLLFVASVPAWWLFEALNRRTGNWEYLGSNAFTDLEYYLLCTVSFSTVMPAVFETAELVGSFNWLQKWAAGPCVRPTQALNRRMFFAGAAMLALTLAWPRVCYPFVWTSLVFILEPLNCWLGRLAAGGLTVSGCAHLWVVLGNVELLLLS